MALPGVSVSVNDGGLRVQRPVSGTRVLLLGTTTSTGLSVNQPVTVTNVGLAMNALRNLDGTESELSLALADALNGGAELVEVMKIATTNGLEYTGFSTHSRFIALSGAYEALAGYNTDIVVPVGAYAEDPIGNTFVAGPFITPFVPAGVWYSGQYAGESFLRQLAQFCYSQTKDFNTTLGVIGVKPPLLAPVAGAAFFTGDRPNVPGSGQWVPNMRSDTGYLFGTPSLTCLNNWYSYLVEYEGTLTSPAWKSFMSGSTTTYATNYLVSSAFQAQDQNSGSGVVDELGNKVDAGAYVSVVAYPVRTLGANVRKFALEMGATTSAESFNTSGAAAYAGLISSLPPQRGTTNKPVPGIIAERQLKRSQITTLSDRRLVTMIQQAGGNFVVAKGTTGAYRVDDYTRSDFTQLTTVRITHAAIDQVRQAAEPYIGEPINSATQNAMRRAIENGLRSMQLAGAINRFDFALIATPNQVVLGQSSVEMTIVPAFELLNVTISVKLARE